MGASVVRAMPEQMERQAWLRGIQWDKLSRKSFREYEEAMDDAEFQGMGLIARRAYEGAKEKFEYLDRVRA